MNRTGVNSHNDTYSECIMYIPLQYHRYTSTHVLTEQCEMTSKDKIAATTPSPGSP